MQILPTSPLPAANTQTSDSLTTDQQNDGEQSLVVEFNRMLTDIVDEDMSSEVVTEEADIAYPLPSFHLFPAENNIGKTLPQQATVNPLLTPNQPPAIQPLPVVKCVGQSCSNLVDIKPVPVVEQFSQQMIPKLTNEITVSTMIDKDITTDALSNKLIQSDAIGSMAEKGTATQNAVSKLSSTAMTTEVRVPLGEKGWNDAMAQKISWLVGKQIQQAEIRLNPENMGPIEMKINIQNDQTNIQIAAQQLNVREALEAAIPRLREMMAEQSFQQVNVNVNSGWKNPNNQDAHTGNMAGSESSQDEGNTQDEGVVSNQKVSDGLVDHFV